MKIVNIINFVRAVEPRVKDNSFLPLTVKEELKLCNKYNFPSTLLLQYDALIRQEYIDIVREYGKNAELGLWFEVVEPLADACGIRWRGRFPWDWHSDVGFLIGYTPEERFRLIDEAFYKFKEVFGYYPAVAGSWHIDALSLKYMKDKYNIVASCNCKDQYGTDGYTMWGGYWNGAYYPSVNNMFCPANSKASQIDVPVFRMLGSDPIYQYDLGLGELEKGQSVMSLEPVYGDSGADCNWVNNYLDDIFNGKGLALEYTQMGQENSFGWDKIKDGLSMQFEELSKRLENSEIEVLTLGEAGRRFSEKFDVTPAEAVCADKDTLGGNNRSVWYNSRFYRMNILYGNGKFHIRDIYVFRDGFKEKYIDEKENTHVCFFSNIPLADGFRFSSREKIAGAYFTEDGGSPVLDDDYLTIAEKDCVTVKAGDRVCVKALPEKLIIESKSTLHFSFEKRDCVNFEVISADRLAVSYMGHKESIKVTTGKLRKSGDEFEILPENDVICIDFADC